MWVFYHIFLLFPVGAPGCVSLNTIFSSTIYAAMPPKNKLSESCSDEEIWTENVRVSVSVYMCVCVSVPPAVVSNRRVTPRCAYAVIWQWLSLLCQNRHTCTHIHKHTYTCIPDTQSNIGVNETRAPVLHWVHTALHVTLSAGWGERVRTAESTRLLKQGKKGRTEAKRKGRAEEWWILLIAIVIPPLQKMATSIKSLMIPALCHASVGERDQNVWGKGERVRGVMQRGGEIMEWVMERQRNR